MSDKKHKFSFSMGSMQEYIDYTKNRRVPLNIEERDARGWLKWGVENLYPEYLLELYGVKSSKHKTIINRKRDMIAGQGFKKVEGLETFFENNLGKESLDRIALKIATDFMLFGGFSLKVVWNATLTKVNYIEYVPINTLRAGWDYSEDRFNGVFYYSPDWLNYRKASNHPIPIPNFSVVNKAPVQIYYYNTNQYNKFYADPEYSAAINWLESDFEISNFHINSIKNGFQAGYHIHSNNGIPTEEERDEYLRKLKAKFTGTNNANVLLTTYSETSESATTVTPLQQNDNDEKYLNLQAIIRDEIFYSHNIVSPELFGVLVAGKLGGKDELTDALDITQATYINPRQKAIEDALKLLAKRASYDYYDQIKLNKFEL